MKRNTFANDVFYAITSHRNQVSHRFTYGCATFASYCAYNIQPSLTLGLELIHILYNKYMEEIFKPYKDTGYQVSNLGRVIGRRGKLLKTPGSGRDKAYPVVCMAQGIGNTYVHKMVLETFVGPRPEGMDGCHRDGNSFNNSLENLEWGTKSSNTEDSVKHGTHYQARKTHCKRGHELGGLNAVPSARGRSCLACRRADAFVKYRTKKGEVWDEADIKELADEYLSLLLHA